jgi:propionate catabolism operon transcriptional regulator
MERLALFLAAEPLQALTPGFVAKITPEMLSIVNSPLPIAAPADSLSLPDLMEKFNHNRERVAEYLGISRTTLWRRLAQLKNKNKMS